MSGLIHIYCGDGKGKTTAAVGLAVRAAGAGKRVMFVQFLKDGTSSEIDVLNRINGIDVYFCDTQHGFIINMTKDELNRTRTNAKNLISAVIDKSKQNIDLLVLDEIVASCNYDIADENELTEFLKNKPQELEVVMTGRNPSEKLTELADYITEMKKIKHPYDIGISARMGIEY